MSDAASMADEVGATSARRILIAGGTGRTGRHVVRTALDRGLVPVALARDKARARRALSGDLTRAEIAVGDLTEPGTLTGAVRDADAVIFVHGSDGEPGSDSFQRIDYGGVVNLLRAFGERRPRVVLMTTFFITHRDDSLNDGGHALDWKRRSERFVRSRALPYTIVRPGWLDVGPAGNHITLRQGDEHEGSITRENLADVLIEALLNDQAVGKTFEVFSGPDTVPSDWPAEFASLHADSPGAIDAYSDPRNLPLEEEPSAVRNDLAYGFTTPLR